MTQLPAITDGTLADHTLRKGQTIFRIRDNDPGINQSAQDTVLGAGSSDYDGESTDIIYSGGSPSSTYDDIIYAGGTP